MVFPPTSAFLVNYGKELNLEELKEEMSQISFI